MVRRGGYRTQAQKEGRSAGQRKRRQARERKRTNRELNIYQITVRDSVVKNSRRENAGTFGMYENNGEWVLTAMAVRRSEEKLVSDRQGATKSKVRDRLLVTSVRNKGHDPRDGLELERFETKKAAMNSISAESSTRIDSGLYIVRPDDWNRSMTTYKVDRNDYQKFMSQRCVSTVNK